MKEICTFVVIDILNKMETPKYISHLKVYENGWAFQSNEEHSKGVARLAASFAQKVGFEDWGTILGLLHDKGKEQEVFVLH